MIQKKEIDQQAIEQMLLLAEKKEKKRPEFGSAKRKCFPAKEKRKIDKHITMNLQKYYFYRIFFGNFSMHRIHIGWAVASCYFSEGGNFIRIQRTVRDREYWMI